MFNEFEKRFHDIFRLYGRGIITESEAYDAIADLNEEYFGDENPKTYDEAFEIVRCNVSAFQTMMGVSFR